MEHLGWFVENFCQELHKTSKGKVYETLNREAAAVPAGCDGLIFLPYMAGERTPHADPDARGCFVGLTLTHTRGHMVRAIMEGVTFAMRDSLEIIQDLDVPVRQVRVSGGGSKSELWRQIQADVFAKPAVTINAEQGPAFGVALLGCRRRRPIQKCDSSLQCNDQGNQQDACHREKPKAI